MQISLPAPAATNWMFHYVRPTRDGGLPHLKAFPLDEFRRFLDTVGQQGRIVDLEAFGAAVDGRRPLPVDSHLLTFDDGLSDHFRWVFPELQKRGLTALFNVTTGPLREPRLLPVHKTHVLYGTKGSDRSDCRES